MKWYGSPLQFSKINKSLSIFSKTNLKSKLNSLSLSHRRNYNLNIFFLYLPFFWNVSIFQNKNFKFNFFFFYATSYYFFLPLFFSDLLFKFDRYSRTFSIFLFYNNVFFKTFLAFFKKIFYSFSIVFFKKLKFKGKGYYIYKNKRNTIALQFGYSHIKRLFFFFTCVRFLSKTSILVFGVNKTPIITASNALKITRPINIFTGKGVRFNRQIVYRKTGKVSSYR